ncbi:MAG TPA: hypothetical protein VI564_05485 [Candidatus Nanoarchaeia archaeon]|nr:hypothetical protein [Candidatus Nanoarchaeia archaeon]
MNTSQSFSGYKSRLGGLGEFSDNTKRLIVVGYLGSDFFITERLMGQDFGRCYNHASNIAGSIESILKESFGPLEVIGTQTPSKKDNTQGNFYSAFFHSSDDAGLVY